MHEVVTEDQEELVADAGVGDETLIEDIVLTSQRNSLESDSEHSGSSSEARSELYLLGSDANEDENKRRRKP